MQPKRGKGKKQFCAVNWLKPGKQTVKYLSTVSGAEAGIIASRMDKVNFWARETHNILRVKHKLLSVIQSEEVLWSRLNIERQCPLSLLHCVSDCHLPDKNAASWWSSACRDWKYLCGTYCISTNLYGKRNSQISKIWVGEHESTSSCDPFLHYVTLC